jgi:hypothetical protein
MGQTNPVAIPVFASIEQVEIHTAKLATAQRQKFALFLAAAAFLNTEVTSS